MLLMVLCVHFLEDSCLESLGDVMLANLYYLMATGFKPTENSASVWMPSGATAAKNRLWQACEL